MLTSDPWLICHRPNPGARLRLFCFPYAGGMANIYRKWPELLPRTVEVWAIQPPGRGSRFREPPFTRLPDLTEQLVPALRSYLTRPFAFFGHSMGTHIGFELARRLRRERLPGPLHLFVSGCRALQLKEDMPQTHLLPDAEFVAELRRLSGTPREVLEHPELMQLLLPLLRADFALTQIYQYQEEPPLDCPITAFGGWQDEEIDRASVEAWGKQTTAAFSSYMLPGDHFFLHTAERQLCEVIALKLERIVAGLA